MFSKLFFLCSCLKIGDSNRITLIFSSRVVDVMIRILSYIVSYLTYCLKCPETFFLSDKSSCDAEYQFVRQPILLVS